METFKCDDLKQAHCLVGNGVHLPNLTMVLLAALASAQLRECDKSCAVTLPWQVSLSVVDEFRMLSERGRTSKPPFEYMAYLLGGITGNIAKADQLWVPAQQAMQDQVWQTSDDMASLVQVLGEDRRIVGWIHLHPDFDAFLSSVDQHMQTSLQLLGDHVVAGVMDQYGATYWYQMTAAGLKHTRACEAIGFHPHPEGMFSEVDIALLQDKKALKTIFEESEKGDIIASVWPHPAPSTKTTHGSGVLRIYMFPFLETVFGNR